MLEQDAREDAANGRRQRYDDLIHHRHSHRHRRFLLHSGPKAEHLVAIMQPHNQLARLPRLDGPDVQVVEVMVDLGRHLGRHEEEAVGGEDEQAILRLLVAHALLQLDWRAKEDFNVLAERLTEKQK